MSFRDVTDRKAVINAIEEFNTLGRDEFLAKYSFKRARIYFLIYEGKQYDCKPVLWAAYQFQFGEPLVARASGGVNKTVRPHLQNMGFQVVAEFIQEASVALPEEAGAQDLWEGAKQTITVNSYERSVAARAECIEHHGSACCVCGFDFAANYGETFLGFIHVHHLVPLSEIKVAHKVNAKEDLRPVCPNCHAVIHYGGETRSIEEVQKLVSKSHAKQ